MPARFRGTHEPDGLTSEPSPKGRLAVARTQSLAQTAPVFKKDFFFNDDLTT